jgi:hypothetical protein
MKRTVRVRIGSVNSPSVVPDHTTPAGRRRFNHLDLAALPTRLLVLEKFAIEIETLSCRMRRNLGRPLLCPSASATLTELEWLVERGQQIEHEVSLRVLTGSQISEPSTPSPEAER